MNIQQPSLVFESSSISEPKLEQGKLVQFPVALADNAAKDMLRTSLFLFDTPEVLIDLGDFPAGSTGTVFLHLVLTGQFKGHTVDPLVIENVNNWGVNILVNTAKYVNSFSSVVKVLSFSFTNAHSAALLINTLVTISFDMTVHLTVFALTNAPAGRWRPLYWDPTIKYNPMRRKIKPELVDLNDLFEDWVMV